MSTEGIGETNIEELAAHWSCIRHGRSTKSQLWSPWNGYGDGRYYNGLYHDFLTYDPRIQWYNRTVSFYRMVMVQCCFILASFDGYLLGDEDLKLSTMGFSNCRAS